MLVQDILASLDWYAVLYYVAPVMAFALAAEIIYLRHFHPLAGFPGPFLGSISNFYAVYMFFTWRMEELEMELHKKYGKRLILLVSSIHDTELILPQAQLSVSNLTIFPFPRRPSYPLSSIERRTRIPTITSLPGWVLALALSPPSPTRHM